MKKRNLLIYFIFFGIFLSCQPDDSAVRLITNGFEVKLLNYSSLSYKSAKLHFGAKDMNGNFIATDSIRYNFVPSNLSPTGSYTHLDNCPVTCGNEGLINGFHYFFSNGEHFVQIPLSNDYPEWQPDVTEIVSISNEFYFVFKLSNGEAVEIQGYDLNRIPNSSWYSINISLTITIDESGLSGQIGL